MTTKLTREQGLELLKKYNKEPFHILHGLTVEGTMRWFANELGYGEDADFWAMAGLLHDIDFEMYPEQHCIKAPELLREAGAEEELIQKVNDQEYIVEGSMNLDDLNDNLGTKLESEDYDSLGGFIIEHLDRLPELGDSVTTSDGIRLVVESLDKNRIEKVHVYLPEKVDYDEDSEE